MREIFLSTVTELAQDPKVAKVVVGSGLMTSMGTVLEWLPALVGVVASSTTILLSLFLLYFHWKKTQREEEKHRIEMAILRTRRESDPAPITPPTKKESLNSKD